MTAGKVHAPVIIPLRPPVPGQPKSIIDSLTRIELATETVGANIFFTIDGSKPQPFSAMGKRATFKYRQPFPLPPGKRTIKAVAYSKDGRSESTIVTKTFDVEAAEGPQPPTAFDAATAADSNFGRLASDNAFAFLDDLRPPASQTKQQQPLAEQSRVRRSHATGERIDGGGIAADEAWSLGGVGYGDIEEDADLPLELERRPIDWSRQPPGVGVGGAATGGGRMSLPQPHGPCPHCAKQVPLGLAKCVVCDLPFAVAPPPPPPPPAPPLALPAPSFCGHCRRLATGRPDAFYCDCCGRPLLASTAATPASTTGFSLSLAATRQASRQPAQPPVPTLEAGTQTVGLLYPSALELRKLEAELQELRNQQPVQQQRRQLISAGPQQQQQQQQPQQPAFPTTVSPGRGYWRRQLEHIVAHLKMHADSSPEFRASIGAPRMERLVRSRVTETAGDRLLISLEFALRDERQLTRAPVGPASLAPRAPRYGGRYGLANGYGYGYADDAEDDEDYVAYGERELYRSDDDEDGESVGNDRDTRRSERRSGKKSSAAAAPSKKSARKAEVEEQNPADKALFRECGAKGEGRPEEIRSLVTEQSADPKAFNANGVPVLSVAVRNLHVDAVKELLDLGADVNTAGREKGNTPLHEAVMKGYDGQPIVDILLKYGADISKKNGRNQTPLDMAKKANFNEAISSMTSSMGQARLNRMLKPRVSADNDL